MGRSDGRPVMRCLNCGSGMFVTNPGRAMVSKRAKTRAIPSAQWETMRRTFVEDGDGADRQPTSPSDRSELESTSHDGQGEGTNPLTNYVEGVDRDIQDRFNASIELLVTQAYSAVDELQEVACAR